MSLPEIPGYRLVKLLHEGSRAEVYLAEQRSLQRLVAVKLLRPGMAGDPLARQQLVGEGKSAARMSHPNVLAVFDIGEIGGLPYIATEYLPKGTLRERLETPFDASTVLRLARDLAHGLKYLHEQGFLHRDLKPANVYFRDDGTAVLADAGITRKDRALHPDDGYAWGSPYYMCPEQAQGDSTDVRSDLYSLGAMLYEVLAGRPPFEGDDPMAIVMAHVQEAPAPLPTAVRGWQPLIDRLLAKSPSGRLPDADTVLLALERIAPRVLPAAAAPAAPPAATTVAAVIQPAPPAGFEPVPLAFEPAATMVASPFESATAAAPPFEPAATMVATPFEPASTLVFPGGPALDDDATRVTGSVPEPPPRPVASRAAASVPPELPAATMVQAPPAWTAVQPPMPPVPAEVTAPRRPLPGSVPNARPSPWPWIVLSLALLIGTVLLFAWWGSRKPSDGGAAAPVEAEQQSTGETVEALTARARRYEQREEWTTVDGDGSNAALTWRQVLTQDPGNAEAEAALRSIHDIISAQIETAMANGQLATARALLEQAVQAFPEDAEFQAKLQELQAPAG